MTNGAGMRKLALGMPGAEERSHFEQPDFRVRNKIFAGLSRDEKRGVLKLPADLQSMLLDAKPAAFSPAPGAWGRSGWTYVELARVELEELRELVVEAYRLIAPKKLTSTRAGGKDKPAARKVGRTGRRSR
jgi:hypothetical protein